MEFEAGELAADFVEYSEAQIEATIEILTESVKRLRAMSSLAGD